MYRLLAAELSWLLTSLTSLIFLII